MLPGELMDLQYREVLATDPALPREARAILSSGRIKIWTCFYETLQVGHCEGDTVTGEIIGMSVLSAHRRCGVGTKLLTLVVDSLRAAGCSRIWLDAPSDPTLPAYGFYRALGWEPTGLGTGDPRYPGVILELPSKDAP
jgi:ribosomal protein S18 acetylase RimI-like enzyme